MSEIDDIPSLRGWFLKQKSEQFKRRGLGTSTNRRWFTIERISSGNKDGGDSLALCYYKKSSNTETEQRCGWIFLNDVQSLSQDLHNRFITIEHPTRVLRLQSPTPAQQRVWFSTLSKCCTNVREEVVSPSSSVPSSEERRPSLPYFDDTLQKARKNSLTNATAPVPSTPKDELRFLQEITGGGEVSKEDQVSKTLFSEPSLHKDKECNKEKENVFNKAENSDLGGTRLSSAISNSALSPESEEKKEEEPLTYDGYGFEEVNGGANTTPSRYSLDACDSLRNTNDEFDMKQLRKALSVRESSSSSLVKQKVDIPTSQSFSSSHRSSSYRLYFGNDDDDDNGILPDDNFVASDWDDDTDCSS